MTDSTKINNIVKEIMSPETELQDTASNDEMFKLSSTLIISDNNNEKNSQRNSLFPSKKGTDDTV